MELAVETTSAPPHFESRWSPPVEITTMSLGDRTLHVAREDLLPGGTKQRAIVPFLVETSAWGPREFIYAGPFCGFAQIALAYSCHALGLKARLFCERDPVTGGAHAYSKIAEEWGATISLHDSLALADRASRECSARQGDKSFLVPLGFAHPLYLRHLSEELTQKMEQVTAVLGPRPRRLWLPVGSGTLARAFKASLNPALWSIVCVDVQVLPKDDWRIGQLEQSPGLEFMRVAEKFHEPAVLPPEAFPSNLHYDAKLWRHFSSTASDGDMWWNVAG
jgi:hypothetical protein